MSDETATPPSQVSLFPEQPRLASASVHQRRRRVAGVCFLADAPANVPALTLQTREGKIHAATLAFLQQSRT
jgi:hypothetical protein